MLDPLTPPARLTPLGKAGDEVCTHLVLRDISVDVRLAIQGDDIVMDEGACTLALQGQGEAFAIRGFQGDMRLKLRLVLLGEVEDPPELVGDPIGFEVTSGLCQGWSSDTQHDSEQEEPTELHTGSF